MNQTKRLAIVLALNLFMIAGLIIVGLSSHSLGVLAAGGDYVADSMAIVLGLIAIRLRQRASGKSKATTVVAAVNGSFLLIVTVIVSIEALRRLIGHSPQINGLPVLIISSIAASIMIVGAFILGGDKDDDDLHMRSVVLDTVSDAVSAGAVAITGAIIYFVKNWYWLDAAVALFISFFIAAQAIKLLRDVARDLLSPKT